MRTVETAATLFEKDLATTKEIINWNVLSDFIGTYTYSEIGKRKDGNPTTLLDEIKTLGKWFAKIEVITINYFHSRKAMYNAEYTAEERAGIAEQTYYMAVNKILWLNCVCKSISGNSFLINRIDKSNVSEVRMLVDAFAFAIQNPDAMQEA